MNLVNEWNEAKPVDVNKAWEEATPISINTRVALIPDTTKDELKSMGWDDEAINNYYTLPENKKTDYLYRFGEATARSVAAIPPAIMKRGAAMAQAIEEISPASIVAAPNYMMSFLANTGKWIGLESTDIAANYWKGNAKAWENSPLARMNIASLQKIIGGQPLGGQAVEYWKEKEEGIASKEKDVFLSNWSGAVRNTVDNLLNIGLAIALKRPEIALPMMAGGSALEDYADKSKMTTGEKTASSVMNYATEYYTEKIPVGELLKQGSSLGKRLYRFLFTDLAGENIATLIESSVIDKATTRPNMTAKELLTDIINTNIQTIMSAGMISGGSHAMVKWAESKQKQINETKKDILDTIEKDVTGLAKKEASAIENGEKTVEQVQAEKDRIVNNSPFKDADPYAQALDIIIQVAKNEGAKPDKVENMDTPEKEVVLTTEEEAAYQQAMKDEGLEIDPTQGKYVYAQGTNDTITERRLSEKELDDRLKIWQDWLNVRKENNIDLTEADIEGLAEVAQNTTLNDFLAMTGETKGKPSAIWKETGLAKSAVEFWRESQRLKGKDKLLLDVEGFVSEDTGELFDDVYRTDDAQKLQAMVDRFQDIKVALQRKLAGQKAAQDIYNQTKSKLERVKRSIGSIKTRIRNITGQTRLNNLVKESDALTAAFKKAQEASRVAFREGKRTGIEEMKYIMMLKNNRDALLKEVRTLKKNIAAMAKKANKAKVEPEYREAVTGIIDGTLDLGAFIAEREKQGDVLYIPQDQIDLYSNTDINDMTLDELRNINSLAKMMLYQGRALRAIMEYGKAVELKDRINQISDSIGKEFNKTFGQDEGLPLPPSSRKLGRYAAIKDAVEGITMYLKKVEYITDWLDGFQKNGIVWKTVFLRMVQAERTSLKRGFEIAKGLTEAVSLLKGDIKSIVNDRNIQISDGRMFTHEEGIMIALNSGNDGNYQRLREGYRLSDKDIQVIIAHLTKSEKQFVDQIFNLVDSQKQEIADVYRALTGEKMKFVEGRYFPIITDKEMSDLAAQREMERDLLKENFYKAAVAKGFTQTRRGGTEAPLLKFDVIIRHLTDTNHFVSHAVAVKDIQKVILNPLFKQAVTKSVGNHAYNQFMPWLKSIANGNYEALKAWDKVLGHIRNNTAVAILGWSLSVALIQPMAYTQAINKLGVKDSMSGLLDFYKNYKDNLALIYDMSPYMMARTQTFDADLKNIMEQDKDTIWKNNRMKRTYYALMSWTDKLVTLPTWWTAYNQEMKKTGNQELSIEYADKIVRNTQSSGAAKDLAEVQRGSNARRAFVMFYSYFSSTYNELAQSHNMVKSGKVGFSELVKSYWWLIALPSIVSTIFKKGKDWPEEELETIFSDFAKGMVGYGFGTIPILNSVMNSFIDGYNFRPTPMTGLPEEIIKTFQSKDVPKAFQHGVLALGYLFGIPGRQIGLAADFVLEALEDGEINPSRLIYKETKRR